LASGKHKNRIEVEFLDLGQFVREASETKKNVFKGRKVAWGLPRKPRSIGDR
jgi:hypothetical protein